MAVNRTLDQMLDDMRELLSDMESYNETLIGYHTLDRATVSLGDAESYLTRHWREVKTYMPIDNKQQVPT